MKNLIIVAITLLAMFSCTQNQRAKSFGGTDNVKLKPNEVFINITWKHDSMWITTKDTITGIIYSREKSSYGLMEGTIIVK
jgi:hypothetical protein